jgi:hypothetical protein
VSQSKNPYTRLKVNPDTTSDHVPSSCLDGSINPNIINSGKNASFIPKLDMKIVKMYSMIKVNTVLIIKNPKPSLGKPTKDKTVFTK